MATQPPPGVTRASEKLANISAKYQHIGLHTVNGQRFPRYMDPKTGQFYYWNQNTETLTPTGEGPGQPRPGFKGEASTIKPYVSPYSKEYKEQKVDVGGGKLTRDELKRYNELSGEAQYKEAVRLNIISSDTKPIYGDNGEWTGYIPEWSKTEKATREFVKQGAIKQASLKEFKKNNILLPDGQYIAKSDLEELRENNIDLYRIMTNKGYNAYQEAYNNAKDKLNQYRVVIKTYTDDGKLRLKKTDAIDTAKAIQRGNLENEVKLLFGSQEVERAKNAIIPEVEAKEIKPVSLPVSVIRFLTPWSEESGQTALAYYKGQIKGEVRSQDELKQIYESEQKQALWQKLLFGDASVIKGKDGKYYQIVAGEMPLISGSASTAANVAKMAQNVNKLRKIAKEADLALEIARKAKNAAQIANKTEKAIKAGRELKEAEWALKDLQAGAAEVEKMVQAAKTSKVKVATKERTVKEEIEIMMKQIQQSRAKKQAEEAMKAVNKMVAESKVKKAEYVRQEWFKQYLKGLNEKQAARKAKEAADLAAKKARAEALRKKLLYGPSPPPKQAEEIGQINADIRRYMKVARTVSGAKIKLIPVITPGEAIAAVNILTKPEIAASELNKLKPSERESVIASTREAIKAATAAKVMTKPQATQSLQVVKQVEAAIKPETKPATTPGIVTPVTVKTITPPVTKPPTTRPPTRQPPKTPPKTPTRTPPPEKPPPKTPPPRFSFDGTPNEQALSQKQIKSAIAWNDGFVVHVLTSPYRRGVDEHTYHESKVPAGIQVLNLSGKGSQQASARIKGRLRKPVTIDVGNQDVIITPSKGNRVRMRHVRDTRGTVSQLTVKKSGKVLSKKKGRIFHTKSGGGTIYSRRPIRGYFE